MNGLRILVTRPLPDGTRTAKTLRALGHDVLLAPLTRIESVAADFGPVKFAAILITSANAARAIAGHARCDELKKFPVYAVGRHSADAAREAGFSDVTSADGDASDLARIVSARGASAPLLYLAAQDRAGDLPGELAACGIAVTTAVIYRAAAVPFPQALSQALKSGALDAVLHFSRRSAELYLKGAGETGVAAPALALHHYCLSKQVAEPLRQAGAGKISIAPRPDEAALIGCLTLPQG
ncbi:MAG: uroporphyrinogen-III synthase [Hyphomicrobiales bacterium]